MTKKREYFVSEPPSKATASVIWLHGLGADGNDFAGIADQLGLPSDHGVRFIFPSAPFMNITINNGMLMRAWYDIYALNMLAKEDEIGIQNSQQYITDFIAHEQEQGIPIHRIILAGFSQGGAMSLYTALHLKESLGGVIVLSAYLPLQRDFVPQAMLHKALPIFMAHGLYDPVVPYNLGLNAFKFLQENSYDEIEWHSYQMQHTLCMEEINAIGKFIGECLDYA